MRRTRWSARYGKRPQRCLLESRIGQRFDGIVTGASEKGTWVRIRRPLVEGRLERGYEGLEVGDHVRVKLVHTDPAGDSSILREARRMSVHLVNPSHVSFGIGVITPRWLYVLAAATPESLRRCRSSSTRRSNRSIFDDQSRATSSASASIPATRCAVTRWAPQRGSGRATSCTGAFTRRSIPEEARDLGGAHAVVTGDGDHVWPRGAARRGRRRAAADVRRRARRRRRLSARPLGPAARRTLHVGLGADRSRLPEALLLLLGVADRRPAPAAARHVDAVVRGNRRPAAPRLPVHRARRRQFLSRHARRPAHGRRVARTNRSCSGSRRSAPSDSS